MDQVTVRVECPCGAAMSWTGDKAWVLNEAHRFTLRHVPCGIDAEMVMRRKGRDHHRQEVAK